MRVLKCVHACGGQNLKSHISLYHPPAYLCVYRFTCMRAHASTWFFWDGVFHGTWSSLNRLEQPAAPGASVSSPGLQPQTTSFLRVLGTRGRVLRLCGRHFTERATYRSSPCHIVTFDGWQKSFENIQHSYPEEVKEEYFCDLQVSCVYTQQEADSEILWPPWSPLDQKDVHSHHC